MTEESEGSDDEIWQHRLPWRSDSTLICTLLSVYTCYAQVHYVYEH